MPVEAKDYPGFFEIRGFTRYVIDRTGRVIDRVHDEEIQPWRQPEGYYNFNLSTDGEYTTLCGRHRLLAVVFKYPGKDVRQLVVNHINGVKGDDRLENLEWVTYQENQEHAGELGLTQKCQPISVRDVYTGVVTDFPSFIACALEYDLTKDAIAYRLKLGEKHVFPEGRQYRYKSVTTPWVVPENIETALALNGTSKAVLVRYLQTGEILEFPKLTEAAEHLGIALPTISQWIRLDQPVLPGLVQIRLVSDKKPWRKVEDPYIEYERFSGRRCVKVTRDDTGISEIFLSAKACADQMGLKTTALNHRLKTNGETVFSDGFRYEYYWKKTTNGLTSS